MEAAAVGSAGIDAAIRTMERTNEKLPHDFIGHWILGWGSVIGGSELWRGAPGLFPRRRCSDNPLVDDPEVIFHKTKLQNRVVGLLSGLTWSELSPPLVTRYCRICRSLHRLYFGEGEDPCRKEGEKH